MLRLYYAPQTRAGRARWMLEEVEVPYELIRLDLTAREQKNPEYLKLNPNGSVPTLADGDLVIYESAAICQYLADKFPEKRLAPPVGTPARGLYYQWIHYAMSGLEPPILAIFLHTAFRPEAERIPKLVDEARPQLAKVLGVVEQALAGRPFLLGSEFTAADVMVGSTIGWAAMMGLLGDTAPGVAAYANRLRERPAFQRASSD